MFRTAPKQKYHFFQGKRRKIRIIFRGFLVRIEKFPNKYTNVPWYSPINVHTSLSIYARECSDETADRYKIENVTVYQVEYIMADITTDYRLLSLSILQHVQQSGEFLE